MKYDDLTIQKLRELSILDVADNLGFKLTGLGDECRRAICPYHDDKHPSLHFSKKKGIFKCFVCGAKGDLFKLVMDDRNCTFPEACEWLVKEFNIVVVPDAPIKSNTNRRQTEWHQASLNARGAKEEDKVNLTNLTNKKFSNSQILDPEKNHLSDSTNSCSENKSVSSVQSVVPLSPDLVSRSLSLDSQFCQSVVSAGYLSERQLRNAADRYRLGCTKDGGVIFWEIDDHQRVHTGKIMYYKSDCHRDKQRTPTWIHSLMKDKLPQNYELQHCLFGLHLLGAEGGSVAIVESEKTAVILSEIIKDFIWLSCGGLQMFKPELLAPLVNHKVIIFPDTDETGEAFNSWLTVLQQASKLYTFKYPLRISNLLEQHTSPDQKQRKIDLVDFLFETREINEQLTTN